MKKLLLAILFLAGCSAVDNDVQGLLTNLASITQADLENATLDAQAHNDTLALACYQSLKTAITTLRDQKRGTINGVISAYQRQRDIGRRVDAGVPDYLRAGCGGLLIDQRDFILKMGLMVHP